MTRKLGVRVVLGPHNLWAAVCCDDVLRRESFRSLRASPRETPNAALSADLSSRDHRPLGDPVHPRVAVLRDALRLRARRAVDDGLVRRLPEYAFILPFWSLLDDIAQALRDDLREGRER